MIKRFGLSHRVALGLEGGLHQLFEDRWGQKSPALGQRPIGDGLAGKLFHMLGQCASLGDHMEDQALDQLHSRDHRGTAATDATTAEQGINKRAWDQLFE